MGFQNFCCQVVGAQAISVVDLENIIHNGKNAVVKRSLEGLMDVVMEYNITEKNTAAVDKRSSLEEPAAMVVLLNQNGNGVAERKSLT